ncbi:MAG: tyrosine-type recombinase/integrase [Deltaproteobacteria bacterium]|nr:tyrosine-type recombinase/integrase [Deltaproteobacteria bacterium]
MMTDSLMNWRRYLKRRNCSPNTIKNYMNTIKAFIIWLDVPVENVTHAKVSHYIDHLMRKRLKPKTINCNVNSVRQFYHYLREEEHVSIINPVRQSHALKMPKPLPRHLRDEQVEAFFGVVKGFRDRAMFMLMLRCGLRVEEVANLCLGVLDFKQQKIIIEDGKGSKDRVVYMSNDAFLAMAGYLRVRPPSKSKKIFLVEKGTFRGNPISIRGIQKRMEYYAHKAKLRVSCHHLRHTMATQLLNADADLCTIQDLLGHSNVKTTQRYCRVSNLKVQRDYSKAMEVIMQRTVCSQNKGSYG